VCIFGHFFILDLAFHALKNLAAVLDSKELLHGFGSIVPVEFPLVVWRHSVKFMILMKYEDVTMVFGACSVVTPPSGGA